MTKKETALKVVCLVLSVILVALGIAFEIIIHR